MKITAGSFKRRTIVFQTNDAVRPTKAKVREAMFNILKHRFVLDFASVSVLDAFAGSGALGFEAASFGAQSVTFVEKDASLVAALRQTAGQLGPSTTFQILCGDFRQMASRLHWAAPFGLVFLDPPYGHGLIPEALRVLLDGDLLAKDALLVLEYGKREAASLWQELQPQWHPLLTRSYGNTTVAFVQQGAEADPSNIRFDAPLNE